MATNAIHWWNDGELPLVGRGADGLIYVVSTYLPAGTSIGCLGCVRGPTLGDVLSAFGRGLREAATPISWVSYDDYPAGSLRRDAMLHKARAEAAASWSDKAAV